MSDSHTADLPYWLGLVRFPKFNARHMRRIMEHFASMKAAFCASKNALRKAGIDAKIATAFINQREDIYPEKELSELKKHGIDAVLRTNARYPALLNEIYDPPAVLFTRGRLPDASKPHLAVVGSRKATDYGRRATKRLIEPLAAAGVVIVSGLAYGIDGCAHRAALEVNGQTIAVLGTGVDDEHLYPARHRSLAKRIIDGNGAVVSEFPIGTEGLPQHFPIRNRVIAGLCQATLVVEAAQKSGSLITAHAALRANRDVLAVPGPIESKTSVGTNDLIKTGAGLVRTPEDIFEALGLDPDQTNRTPYSPKNTEEERICNELSHEPKHIDEITTGCDLPASKTMRILTLLEMRGVVVQTNGARYVLERRIE